MRSFQSDLVHISKKNLRRLFDKYDVARTEHDALVKSTTKIFSNFVAFSENPNFSKVEFVRSFFGGIKDTIICFRDYLTFSIFILQMQLKKDLASL